MLHSKTNIEHRDIEREKIIQSNSEFVYTWVSYQQRTQKKQRMFDMLWTVDFIYAVFNKCKRAENNKKCNLCF